jgi:hypothetical protein
MDQEVLYSMKRNLLSCKPLFIVHIAQYVVSFELFDLLVGMFIIVFPSSLEFVHDQHWWG